MSLGSFISSFSGYSLLQFSINFRHFFQLPNCHFWCHAACSSHHHMPSMSSPNPPFHLDPCTSEFIETMKSAATPPPRRSTRNAKAKAPYSPDQGKAPPPSFRATRADKKRQTTETAPSTPIAPSPSGNPAASLSLPLFFIPEATASNTPVSAFCCWCF